MLNAYQRPLFRQAGGPAGVAALPPPAPAGVASLPQQDPQGLLDAAGKEVFTGMEGVGQDYVISMVNRLDTAEDFKQVIDSLRGNEVPMEERYGELAEYVGEEDAEKTPESVLAMVQPVIMMTEEGNVDSGIGELMQGVAGEVDMMTEGGQLTDMGQGVGSLMAANQEAPVQQFAAGGPVQHFQDGAGVTGWRRALPWNWGGSPSPTGPTVTPEQAARLTAQGRVPQPPGMGLVPSWERGPLAAGRPSSISGIDYAGMPSIPQVMRGDIRDVDLRTAPGELESRVRKTFEKDYQPLYRGILDPEKERQMTKSQIMFDIAQAGLNFASGVDPRTGQSMTQLPVAAQLATAAGGLPQQIGARVAAQRQAVQSADLMALQSAIKTEEARIAAVEKERLTGSEQNAALLRLGYTHASTQSLQKNEARYREELERNDAQYKAAQANNDFYQQQDLLDQRYELEMQRDGNLHAYNLATIAEEYSERGDLAKLQGGIEKARDWRLHRWDVTRQRLDRNLEEKLGEGQQKIAERAVKLNEEIFEDKTDRQALTYVPWHEGGKIAELFGKDTEADIARKRWDALEEQKQVLMNEAAAVGIDRTVLGAYFEATDLGLKRTALDMEREYRLAGAAAELTKARARQPFKSSIDMDNYLAEEANALAYSYGASMPAYELAISRRFSVQRDPETGLLVVPGAPPFLEGVLRAREARGYAVPDIGQYTEEEEGYFGRRGKYEDIPGQIAEQRAIERRIEEQRGSPLYSSTPRDYLLGRAEGGPVKKLQRGGDPRGLYEPLTETYLPRRERYEEEPVSIEEPIITATGAGVDITAATGADATIVNAANNLIEAVSGINGGPGVVIGPEYQEAMRALDSFNQIALVRALGSIAGKENKELQQRLAKLEVPAGKVFYNDRKALSQFRTSSRVMDFAIREQNAALQGPRLTRAERNKARKDLAALQGIKLEYDRLAGAFERKIEGTTEGVSSELDAFFN